MADLYAVSLDIETAAATAGIAALTAQTMRAADALDKLDGKTSSASASLGKVGEGAKGLGGNMATSQQQISAFLNEMKRVDLAKSAADDMKRMRDEVAAAGTSATTTATSMGQLAAGMALVGTAALAMRKLVAETTMAQDAAAQLTARIQSTGGAAGRSAEQITAMAERIQQTTRFSDDAAIAASAMLMTFTKIRGDQFDRAAIAATNLAAAMGGDLSGAALQVGKALQEPESGLAGLSRAGIQFSESQKAVISSLIETGRRAEAQAIILDVLEMKVGGTAVAMRDTLGGALQALGNDFGDLFEVTKEGTSIFVTLINAIGGTVRALNEHRQILVAITAAATFFVAGLLGIKVMALATAAGLVGLTGATTVLMGVLTSAVGVVALLTVGVGALALGVAKFMDAIDEAADAEERDIALKARQVREYGKFDAASLAAARAKKAAAAEQATAHEKAVALMEKEKAANAALDTASRQGIEGTKREIAWMQRHHSEVQESIRLQRELARVKSENAAEEERAFRIKKDQAERERLGPKRVIENIVTAARKVEAPQWEHQAAKIAENTKRTEKDFMEMMNARAQIRASDFDAHLKAEAAKRGITVESIKLETDLRENFLKQWQQTLANSIANMLENGLSSWRDFFGSIKSMFLKLIADLAATRLTKALAPALNALMPGLVTPAPSTAGATQGTGWQGLVGPKATETQRGLAGAAGGAFAGYATGQALYSSSRSQGANAVVGGLGGAVAGAATGFAVAGPIGAAAGALTGFIGGLLGSAAAAKAAAAEMRELQRALGTSLAQFRAQVDNNPLADALAANQKQVDALKQQISDAYKGSGNEAERTRLRAEVDALGARRAQQLTDEATAQKASAQQDYALRAMRARGLADEADAIAFTLAQERELAEARKISGNEAAVAELERAQAAERERREMDRIQNTRQESGALSVRSLQAGGQTDAAATLEQSLRFEQELYAARARGASPELITQILAVQEAERRALAEQLAHRQAVAAEDLAVRALRAQGRGVAADDMAFRLMQEREYYDASKSGLDAVTLARLKEIQAMEAAARAAEQAATARRALEDLDVRGLRAGGRDAEADALAFDLQQRRELEEARKNFSEEYVRRLEEVQRREREQRERGLQGQGTTGTVEGVMAANAKSRTDNVTTQGLASGSYQQFDTIGSLLISLNMWAARTTAAVEKMANIDGAPVLTQTAEQTSAQLGRSQTYQRSSVGQARVS